MNRTSCISLVVVAMAPMLAAFSFTAVVKTSVAQGSSPAAQKFPFSEGLQEMPVPEHLRGFEELFGSADRGRLLLESGRLSCLMCHTVTPGESSFAPNLLDLRHRLSLEQIVTSIFEPSREFAAGYRSVDVLTEDGRRVSGIVDEEASDETYLVIETATGRKTIARQGIVWLSEPQSDMPTGQADDLTPQEFADLIAFLLSLDSAA
ncbi:MAG: c-type cytochrome [Pirellulaceae bacterium]